MNLKCQICFNDYDIVKRKPMGLPCGHTLCLQCLQKMRQNRCPYCTVEYGDMKPNPNYLVLDAVRQSMEKQKVPDFKKIIKICVVGESGVGKSSLFKRFCQAGRLSDRMSRDLQRSSILDLQPTIGLDFQLVTTLFKDKLYKVQLWDTSGQERYRSLASRYLRRSDLVLLTYSLNDLSSFRELANYWIPAVRGLLPQTPMLIIGNKLDLERQVPEIQLKNLCEDWNCRECKVSCLTGLNLVEVWLNTIELAIQFAESGQAIERLPSINVKKPKRPRSTGCCK